MKTYKTEDGKFFPSYIDALEHCLSLKELIGKFRVGYSVWDTDEPVVWVSNFYAHGFYPSAEWLDATRKYPEMDYNWEYCKPDPITAVSLCGVGISTLERLINIPKGEHVGFKIEVIEYEDKRD